MGHAEAACSQDLIDRIGRWIDQATLSARAVTQAAEPDRPGMSPAEATGEATTPDAAA